MSDENKDHRDENNFFQALGSRGEIKEASEGGDDVAFEKNSQTSVTLYRYATFTSKYQHVGESIEDSN